MTDLTKGIIDINGFEICENITSDEIINKLESVVENHAVSKNGRVEIFTFKNVHLLNRFFDIDVTFINQKLSDTTLFPYYDDDLSYEARFETDCEWLKSILGEPSNASEDSNFYYFDRLHIYSFIQRDLSRSPAETSICCKYDR